MQSYGGPDHSQLQKSQQRAIFTHPATHPWLLDGMPWMLATTNAPQPGGVMQFGGVGAEDNDVTTQCGKWQQKRKSLEQQATGLPPKQLITEERITAHFSGLQISGDANGSGGVVLVSAANHNNNSSVNGGLATDDIPSTSTGKTHHPNPAYQMAAMELEQKLRNAQRIVICDEVKQSVVSPVAEWLIKSIPRPCTALVPWQPPATLLHIPLSTTNKLPAPQPTAREAAATSVATTASAAAVDLDDYDDDELQFFENNNTCNVNLNKSDEQMDEDL